MSLRSFLGAFSPLPALTAALLNRLNRAEYLHPPFPAPNERSVEYGFVFEQITQCRPKTILDVGTGKTALPSLMANCGVRVTAIDKVKGYWKGGLVNQHYYIINDDITDPKLKSRFDMITCVSTLEHIALFDRAVEAMFGLLEKNGHLVLTFPYNEKESVENVYTLPDSEVKILPAYTTRAFSRKDLDQWSAQNNAKLIKQEYWQVFAGEYWSTGKRLACPKKASAADKHQLSCVLFQKQSCAQRL